MKYLLIRHGQTAGNLQGRYIGRTDEPLCPQGTANLRARKYPPEDGVLVSPMRRCIETAAIIAPDVPMTVVDDLRECDFGAFEGKNYAELNGRADYQAWIDSDGRLPFPGGESQSGFSRRCVAAFTRATAGLPEGCYAVIAHGGTVMAIMEAFARPRRPYFDWQVGCGEGFTLNGDGSWERLFPSAERGDEG